MRGQCGLIAPIPVEHMTLVEHPKVSGPDTIFSENSTSPLIKWPGGKRRLLKHIGPLLPRRYKRYFEPFFGGGALFFALRPAQSVLSDRNPDLIEMYMAVRDSPNALVSRLSVMPNDEDEYYRIRDSQPRTKLDRAARFIYLTNLAFNGIHRVNQQGRFNVPYGHKPHMPAFDATLIAHASRALRGAILDSVDFDESLKDARSGDLVYLDPPYTVAHSNNGFIKYNATIFSWEDQERLAATAARLSRRGCRVLSSNADHPSIRKLYPEFKTHTLQRHSVMAASSKFRQEITECIFHNG